MPARIARSLSHRHVQAGFSLIELMIAVLIGMAAVIIMMQMLLNSDTAKRITIGGNDAQMTGNIALHNLDREIRSSGYGLNAGLLLGCEVKYTTPARKELQIPLVPVLINATPLVPAGDNATDTLLVVYGNAEESTDGDALLAASTDTTYEVTTPSTFQVGQDLVVQREVRASPCTLSLSTIASKAGHTVTLRPEAPGVAGFPAGSIVFNLGRLRIHAYAVRQGRLTVCDYRENDCGDPGLVNDDDVWQPVASNVVALRAQYGRDLANTGTALTGSVSVFTRTRPGTTADDSGLPLQCAWARTVALRVGLVTRGGAYDKNLTDPTKQAANRVPTWSGATADLEKSETAGFDLSQSIESTDPKEWQRFRYKTFESTIPLRNLMWQGDDTC